MKNHENYTGDPHQDQETGKWYCSGCPKTFLTEKAFLSHWGKMHDEKR